MQQEIEKLKQEKNKLTTEFQNSRMKYKDEVNKINRAIRSFEKGLSELSGTAVKTKRPKSYSEIEAILKEEGELHLKQLCQKLNERNIPMSYQSLSGLMQLYAKANKMFVKTAPATYALIKQNTEQNLVNEAEFAVKPEVSAESHTTSKANTISKKKNSAKPNANAESNGKVDPEAVEAETAAEKRTIVYEIEESETNESETGGNDERQ
jgi:hypothetical protein